MWTYMKLFGGFVAAALTVVLLASVISGSSLLFYRTWAPAWASAEREVFEETQSYVHGTVRDLRNLRLEYQRSESPSEKQVLKRTILHRAADLDDDVLDDYAQLEAFIDSLRGTP